MLGFVGAGRSSSLTFFSVRQNIRSVSESVQCIECVITILIEVWLTDTTGLSKELFLLSFVLYLRQ